ncbi:RNA-directed DNA polymerase, eukaryota, reverse transcriptase zinc-binding domain protein [Tanacetum coccineum]
MLKEKLRKDIEAVDKSPHDSSLQKEAAKSLYEYVAATRNEVCLVVKEFFRNGKLLGEVNATLIALIPKFFVFLNGEVHGYFKGGRGLRQGDPISPYLFTLVLEVFNVIMCRNIKESEEYGYHFGCKDLKLPHMCFANDLFVQCKGNKESLNVVKKSLDKKRWNEVLLIRQFWKILESKNSLWEKWVNVVKLKKLGVYGILLLIKWGWKTMMGIRDIIKDDVTYEIGSGLNTSMWFDKWCPNGLMCDVILKRTLYEARIKDSVMVNGYG